MLLVAIAGALLSITYVRVKRKRECTLHRPVQIASFAVAGLKIPPCEIQANLYVAPHPEGS